MDPDRDQRKTPRRSKPLRLKRYEKMKAWLTIEPNKEEIDDLLSPEKGEGECKTPLKSVIDQAYCLMMLKHEISLKITTMKRREYE